MRGFSITPSYTLINYALQSSAKLNILCYGMGGTYIILVNHYCSICSCQVINFQIFLCSNFCSLFLEQKNSYKHMVNSPQYIPGLQMLSPCRFREIVTLFEIINDPRLKTEPFVTCFLFFLSTKVLVRWSFYNWSINAGSSTAILVYFYMFYTAGGKKLSFVKWFHVFVLHLCIYF